MLGCMYPRRGCNAKSMPIKFLGTSLPQQFICVSYLRQTYGVVLLDRLHCANTRLGRVLYQSRKMLSQLTKTFQFEITGQEGWPG